MVTSKKPRLHRLAYKWHNQSDSQSFISTVILEKKRNDLHTVSSSNQSSAYSEVSSGSLHEAFSGCVVFWFYVWNILFHVWNILYQKDISETLQWLLWNFSNVLKIRNLKLISRVQTIIPSKNSCDSWTRRRKWKWKRGWKSWKLIFSPLISDSFSRVFAKSFTLTRFCVLSGKLLWVNSAKLGKISQIFRIFLLTKIISRQSKHSQHNNL